MNLNDKLDEVRSRQRELYGKVDSITRSINEGSHKMTVEEIKKLEAERIATLKDARKCQGQISALTGMISTIGTNQPALEALAELLK